MSDKLPYRRELGTFTSQQAQLQGQAAAAKANEHVDALRILNNRAYVALGADSTTGSATYGTLLMANVTTIAARGYLVVTFSSSSTHITNIATTYFQIVVDGVVQKGCAVTFPVVGYVATVGMVVRVPVTRGPHIVLLQWRTDNLTARINAATVIHEHANLLVQEAA